MTILKRILVTILLLCGTAFGSATNVYVTPSGTATGSCPAGTTSAPNRTPAQFNQNTSPVVWGTGAGQIGPGTTVLACGTFTGSAGGGMLTFQGSGTSGNPIIFNFDTTANFTAPYWSASVGAINIPNGLSYITIDGKGTGSAAKGTFTQAGIIQNTCNGTGPTLAGCSGTVVQNSSIAIAMGDVSNITVQNLVVANMYQRTGDSNELPDDSTVRAISWGNGTSGTITINNDSIHDGGFALFGNTSGTVLVTNSEIYNYGHDLASSPTTLIMHDDHFHDWGIWASISPGPPYHNDGLHCYAGPAGKTSLVEVYNNQFDGSSNNALYPTATGFNEFIFPEGPGDGTACLVSGGTVYIFNNVMIANAPAPAFFNLTAVGSGQTGSIVANNTMINNQPTVNTIIANLQTSGVTTAENNAMGGSSILIGGSVIPSIVDYNFYENCTSFNCFFIGGIDTGSFSSWQGNGYDTHGNAYLGQTINSITESGTTVTAVTSSPLNWATYGSSVVIAGSPIAGYNSTWAVTSTSGSQFVFTAPSGLGNCSSNCGGVTNAPNYLGLNSACVPGSVGANCAPQTGSPLIAHGINLTSLCGATSGNGTVPIALCSDFEGNARPTGSTPWDVGALNASSGLAYIGGANPVGTSTTVTSASVTYTPTPGNEIVLFLGTNGSISSVACQDSASNPLTAGPTTNSNLGYIHEFYYSVPSTAPTSFSCSWTTKQHSDITVVEYSGAASVNGTPTGNAAAGQSKHPSISPTSTVTNDLMVAGFYSASNVTSWGTPQTGTLRIANFAAAANGGSIAVVDNTSGSTSGLDVTESITIGAKEYWAGVAIELEP